MTPKATLPTAAIVPVAPNDCNVANAEPAATLPIDDCQAAANEPPAMPALVKPAAVSPVAAITVPVPNPALAPSPISINLR